MREKAAVRRSKRGWNGQALPRGKEVGTPSMSEVSQMSPISMSKSKKLAETVQLDG